MIGPVRLMVTDGRCWCSARQLEERPWLLVGEIIGWVLIEARAGSDGGKRYVIIPAYDGVHWTDFENAFNTLEYLIQNPELRSI